MGALCLGVGPGAETVERGVRGKRRPWREASVERGVCSEAAPGGLKNKEQRGRAWARPITYALVWGRAGGPQPLAPAMYCPGFETPLLGTLLRAVCWNQGSAK